MVVIGTLMAFSVATLANAHTVRDDSVVTFHQRAAESQTFVGRVISQRPRCERERIIRVFQRSGDSQELVGRTTTNNRGRYELEFSGESGTYYAVAARKVFANNAKHLHLCKRAVSKDVRVP